MISKINRVIQLTKFSPLSMHIASKVNDQPFKNYSQLQSGGTNQKEKSKDSQIDPSIKNEPINLNTNADQSQSQKPAPSKKETVVDDFGTVKIISSKGGNKQDSIVDNFGKHRVIRQDNFVGVANQSRSLDDKTQRPAKQDRPDINPNAFRNIGFSSTGGIPESVLSVSGELGYTGYTPRRGVRQVQTPKRTGYEQIPDFNNQNYVGPGAGNPMLKFMEIGRPRYQVMPEGTPPIKSMEDYVRMMNVSHHGDSENLDLEERQTPSTGTDRKFAERESIKKIRTIIQEEVESERVGSVIAKQTFTEIMDVLSNMAIRRSKGDGSPRYLNEEQRQAALEDQKDLPNERIREFYNKSGGSFDQILEKAIKERGIEKKDYYSSLNQHIKNDQKFAKKYEEWKSEMDDAQGGTIDEVNLFNVVQPQKIPPNRNN